MGSKRAQHDLIDLAILKAIQLEGRRSIKDLAGAVSLSQSACLARLRRLEQDGTIRRYIADIAPEGIGRSLTLFVEVTLAGHRSEDFAAFDRAIGQFSEIVEAAQISGAADYMLKVIVPDIEDWGRINDLLTERGIRIASIKTSVVMKAAKRFSGVPVDPLAGMS